jgi:hypothetical protein
MGRSRPSAFGMYVRLTGLARYAPRRSLAYPFERALQVFVGANVGVRSWPCRRFPASCPFRVRHVRSFRPARCPGLVLPDRIPLSQAPFLRPLRRARRIARFVRGLLRYYGSVRLPAAVRRRRARLDSRRGPRRHFLSPGPGGGISRFLLARLVYVRGVFDHAGPEHRSRWRDTPCCLPLDARASAPRL